MQEVFGEPALTSLSDRELGEFFAVLDSLFSNEPRARAWI
jgi:hypothetical protein